MLYVDLECVEDCQGMLGIEYLVVVCVGYAKYACGVVILFDFVVCLLVIPNEGLLRP